MFDESISNQSVYFYLLSMARFAVLIGYAVSNRLTLPFWEAFFAAKKLHAFLYNSLDKLYNRDIILLETVKEVHR